MQKTAVVYDKWLTTLGGGEVVACTFAEILIDLGYKVTFISGKKVLPSLVKEKLDIDLSKANFIEIWNDENELQKITNNKDIFINASFMDYMRGNAKKNFYYTSFPTQSHNNIKGFLLNNYIFPLVKNYVKQVEYLNSPLSVIYRNNLELNNIGSHLSVAFAYLNQKKEYKMQFFIFLESFSKTNLEMISWKLKNASVKLTSIKIDHRHNIIKVQLSLIPQKDTVYLKIINNSDSNNVYLIEPMISPNSNINLFPQKINEKIQLRLRAGIFSNVLERIKSYDVVFANSEFTSRWIKKYWKINSIVLYPPVNLIKSTNEKKKNIICSVGRFFTLGHGKKQEFLIEAFKKMVDGGLINWELHLAGGISNDPVSKNFSKLLVEKAENYPIYFHFNKSRKFIEKLYLESKIYWHATGFNENEHKNPIKFEHFGIAPIEAISAGCIPILFRGGGLTEIINSLNLDQDLYLFKNIKELIEKTNYHIKNFERESIKINKTNEKLKKIYSKQNFKKNFVEKINHE